MWDELAEVISKRIHEMLGNNEDPFYIEQAVKEEIRKFVTERVVMCYFICDAKTVEKAKSGHDSKAQGLNRTPATKKGSD